MSTFKTKNFSDFKNSWSNKDNGENLGKAADIIAKEIKETKLLDWLESKGYGIRYSSEQDFNDGANYDTMGQQGRLYTFYLYKQPTDEIIFDYLKDQNEFKNIDEVVDFFGDKIRTKLSDTDNFDSVHFEPWDIDDENNLVFDENTEIEVKTSSYGEELPHWNAMVPLNNSSENFRKICEFGLFGAKYQLLKLIKITGSNSFSTLSRSIRLFGEDYIRGDGDEVVEYMNMSNVNMRKNEDLQLAIDTKYMLYKTHKLIEEIANHDEFFEIPIEILEEFIKLPLTKLV